MCQALIPFIHSSVSHHKPFLPSQNIIDSYDKDKDGLLDYKEFLSYMMDRERKWKIYFHDLDKNKCGECVVTAGLTPCYNMHIYQGNTITLLKTYYEHCM